MDLDEIRLLRERHGAWRLLRAHHAPVVLSFLGSVFVDGNAGALGQAELAGRLEEFLDADGPREDGGTRRTPVDYLDAWSTPESGWLRRFYPAGHDEVHYEVTPAFEKAFGWVVGLRARPVVGTESRLHTLVELLRQMVHGADANPDTRLAELHRRRAAVDAEIAEVQAGRIAVMDGAALRERYQFFASTARELLADFREVEENFRSLDRGARERIATWEGSKGELLESLVTDRADISSSDQGRSFQAFYDFLLSHERQDELADLLDAVQRLVDVDADPRLRRVHHDWHDAAERTQATVRRLSEQLRRFLDDQVWVENRRVLDLVRRIEAAALELRDESPDTGLEIAEMQLGLALPLERPLYDVRAAAEVDSDLPATEGEVDTSALFEQSYVDQARLVAQIRSVVPPRSSAPLLDVLELFPLRDGVAEVVAYLALSDGEVVVELDESERVSLDVVADGERRRTLHMPAATVVRR